MLKLQEVYLKTTSGEEYAGPTAEGLVNFKEKKSRHGLLLLAVYQSEPRQFQTVDFIFSVEDTAIESVFCNGYQSWTDSREFFPEETIKPLSWLAKPLLAAYGDSHFYQPRAPLYSFGYLYFRFGDDIKLIGSLQEKQAHTIFAYDRQNHRLIVTLDLAGVLVTKGFTLLNLLFSEGEKNKVILSFSEALGIKPLKPQPTTGFTSWYNFYTSISEPLLKQVLKSYSERNIPLDYFQIDDGWQQRVGDWLMVNEKFPSGMAAMAQAIHQANYQAGLWLAPFIVEQKAKLFQEHPEWLLRNSQGKLVKAGFNPLWSYTFYALNWQLPPVQQYLKEVFATVFQKWHFDMVKLDFLYAAALIPINGKSRGQLMHEAMQFLRQLCGKRVILGCGVPLMQAAGFVDYCRIGSDVALTWENNFLRWLHFRERVSTINSLVSTIGRAHPNNLFFRNDPDVFILRSNQKSGEKKPHGLTLAQRHTLLVLNRIFGSLVFTSDEISEYSTKELALYYASFPAVTPEVKRVLFYDMLLRAEINVGKHHYYVVANLSHQEKQIALPEGNWFERLTPQFLRGGALVSLPAFTTLVFLQFDLKPYSFAGSQSHLLPGCEFSALSFKNGKLTVKYHPHARLREAFFLVAGTKPPTLPTNWSVEEVEKAGFRLWRFAPLKVF